MWLGLLGLPLGEQLNSFGEGCAYEEPGEADQAPAPALLTEPEEQAITAGREWSTNPLERLNKEIKRRTRVVGIFPNDAAIIRLVGALLLEQQEEWQLDGRRVFSELSMAKLDKTSESVQDQSTAAFAAAA